jgi:hypothetical protein
LAAQLEDWKEQALVDSKAGLWDLELDFQSEEVSEEMLVEQVDLV